MIQSLGQPQRRQVAVAILVAIVAVLLSITVLPVWLANASRQDTLDQLQQRLSQYERIAAQDSDLLPQFKELKQAQLSAGNYLKSNTVAVAGAELQRMVKDITAANRAQMISTQILPAANEQGFIRVALKVRLRGPLPAILESLYDIETNAVFMFLDNVSLSDSTAGGRPRQIVVQQTDADFDLIAYMPDIS